MKHLDPDIEQPLFLVTEAVYQQLCDRLNQPAIPNPKLEILMKTPAPWEQNSTE